MELQLRFAQFSIRLGPWAAWPAWVLFQLLVAPSAAWLPLLLIDATIERPIVWVWLVWLLFYVVVLVRQARFWRLWLPWTRPTGHRSLELFFGAYQSLVIITAAFAGDHRNFLLVWLDNGQRTDRDGAHRVGSTRILRLEPARWNTCSRGSADSELGTRHHIH
jgi:hypothetical protein